jgi:hypothetical protein
VQDQHPTPLDCRDGAKLAISAAAVPRGTPGRRSHRPATPALVGRAPYRLLLGVVAGVVFACALYLVPGPRTSGQVLRPTLWRPHRRTRQQVGYLGDVDRLLDLAHTAPHVVQPAGTD